MNRGDLYSVISSMTAVASFIPLIVGLFLAWTYIACKSSPTNTENDRQWLTFLARLSWILCILAGTLIAISFVSCEYARDWKGIH